MCIIHVTIVLGDLCNNIGFVGVSAKWSYVTRHHLVIMNKPSLSCLLCFLCMLAIPIFPFLKFEEFLIYLPLCDNFYQNHLPTMSSLFVAFLSEQQLLETDKRLPWLFPFYCLLSPFVTQYEVLHGIILSASCRTGKRMQ